MKKGDKSTNVEVSNKQSEESNKDNPQIDYAKAHKEAQDALTRKAEALIEANVKLAEKDAKSILDLDRKMQNKVIKRIYGYDNLEQLKLIHGDNFYDDKSLEDEEVDKTLSLEKEVKILKYQRENDELNRAFEIFKITNAKLFKENPKALDEIKTELEYISKELPVKERINRASKIVFGNIVSTTDEAYLSLQDVSMGNSSKKKEDVKKSNSSIDDIFSSVLKSKKKKEKYLKKFK